MISNARLAQLRVIAAAADKRTTILVAELDDILGELQRIRPAYEVACDVAKHWHDQAGINVAMLDRLESAIGESLPDPIAKSSIGAALDDIEARGLEAHLQDLEAELDQVDTDYLRGRR